jgi:hypothetical protein
MRTLFDDAVESTRLAARVADLEMSLGSLERRVLELEASMDAHVDVEEDITATLTETGKAALRALDARRPGQRPFLILDLDGVLADFNTGYLQKLEAISGWKAAHTPLFPRWDWPDLYFSA